MKLYEKPQAIQTRWASFENPNAAKGVAAQSNKATKGHAFESLHSGEVKSLLDVHGSGEVTRIWLTISDRSPEILQSLTVRMYWDGSSEPAVEAPLGDFFGIAWGRKIAWESDLFSDPQGKSFNCFIPMPFRKSAKITLTNQSAVEVNYLFYEINFLLGQQHSPQLLYFHSSWRRENPNQLAKDFFILPKVEGQGRLLGCNVGIRTSRDYGDSWWGEGEVKVYLDGDSEYPTLCGTGAEDYIGAAWCQGLHQHRYQGCAVADKEQREWCFYRFHIPDPIYFEHDCRMSIQTIGGCRPVAAVKEMLAKNVRLIPTSMDPGEGGKFYRLLEGNCPVNLDSPEIQHAWVNFYRQDEWCATAYYYLDRP